MAEKCTKRGTEKPKIWGWGWRNTCRGGHQKAHIWGRGGEGTEKVTHTDPQRFK